MLGVCYGGSYRDRGSATGIFRGCDIAYIDILTPRHPLDRVTCIEYYALIVRFGGVNAPKPIKKVL